MANAFARKHPDDPEPIVAEHLLCPRDEHLDRFSRVVRRAASSVRPLWGVVVDRCVKTRELGSS
jgi:hypothetical protein